MLRQIKQYKEKKMVTIGITSYSLSRAVNNDKMSVPEAIKFAAEHGAKHMEISASGKFILNGNPQLLQQVKEEVKKAGMVLSSYTLGANFVQPDTASYRKEIDRIKSEVEIAAQLGVTRMRHDCGWRSGEENTQENFEKDFPLFVDACGEIADHAAKYGITTSVENHGFYVQNSERVRRLIVAVGRKNFRTTLDVGNFLCVDEDPVSAVMSNLPYASMIHFKDFHIRRQATPPPDTAGYIKTLHGKYIRGAITGDGDVDLDTIAKLIKESSYDGFLSVEFEGWGDCIEGCTRAMKNVLTIFDRV